MAESLSSTYTLTWGRESRFSSRFLLRMDASARHMLKTYATDITVTGRDLRFIHSISATSCPQAIHSIPCPLIHRDGLKPEIYPCLACKGISYRDQSHKRYDTGYTKHFKDICLPLLSPVALDCFIQLDSEQQDVQLACYESPNFLISFKNGPLSMYVT